MFQGEHVELEDMLQAREERAAKQKSMIDKANCPVISFTLNIPGSVKHSSVLQKVFEIGCHQILLRLHYLNGVIKDRQRNRVKTGWEEYFSIKEDAHVLKNMMVIIEDNHPLGRLFDIDVIGVDGQKVSRCDEGKERRKCFICGKDAQECARSRAHSISEMQKNIQTMIEDYLGINLADYVSEKALKALLYEVSATPKPGLVDRANSGAHSDMDIFTFLDSASCLQPYFRECVMTGIKKKGKSTEELFEATRYLGQTAQKKMFMATEGVNTHKGIVFSMGLICSAIGYNYNFIDFPSIESVISVIKKMMSNIIEKDLTGLEKPRSFGEKAYKYYGIMGIRGEAQSGFSSVMQIGLPKLEEYLCKGYSANDAGIMTLLNLMATVEDTNLIKRSNINEASVIRNKIARLLKEKNPDELILHEIMDLDNVFIQQGLSPGGCADLLALTYFFHFLKTEKVYEY